MLKNRSRKKKEQPDYVTTLYVRCQMCDDDYGYCSTCDGVRFICWDYTAEEVEGFKTDAEYWRNEAIHNGYDPQCE